LTGYHIHVTFKVDDAGYGASSKSRGSDSG
jgi:hypothetical protein